MEITLQYRKYPVNEPGTVNAYLCESENLIRVQARVRINEVKNDIRLDSFAEICGREFRRHTWAPIMSRIGSNTFRIEPYNYPDLPGMCAILLTNVPEDTDWVRELFDNVKE